MKILYTATKQNGAENTLITDEKGIRISGNSLYLDDISVEVNRPLDGAVFWNSSENAVLSDSVRFYLENKAEEYLFSKLMSMTKFFGVYENGYGFATLTTKNPSLADK